MEYQKIDNKIFVRLDRGDEIISSVLGICKAEEWILQHLRGLAAAVRC